MTLKKDLGESEKKINKNEASPSRSPWGAVEDFCKCGSNGVLWPI